MNQIYSFLIGEPDTVPEFRFTWITVRSATLKTTITPLTAVTPSTIAQTHSSYSLTITASTPHLSPTPSTSGTQPRILSTQAPAPSTSWYVTQLSPQPSTSGIPPTALGSNTSARVLRNT